MHSSHYALIGLVAFGTAWHHLAIYALGAISGALGVLLRVRRDRQRAWSFLLLVAATQQSIDGDVLNVALNEPRERERSRKLLRAWLDERRRYEDESPSTAGPGDVAGGA